MSSKIHMHLLPNPAVPLLDFYCKNILAKNMKRHMYGGTICNSKRVETAQMFSNGELNERVINKMDYLCSYKTRSEE